MFKRIPFFAWIIITLGFISNAGAQGLEDQYKNNNNAISRAKAAEEKAKTQGPQYECPELGLFTFVDGYVFDGNEYNPLGSYKKTGNSFAFSWVEIDRSDNTQMRVLAELNTSSNKLFKTFRRADPRRDDNNVFPYDCSKVR